MLQVIESEENQSGADDRLMYWERASCHEGRDTPNVPTFSFDNTEYLGLLALAPYSVWVTGITSGEYPAI